MPRPLAILLAAALALGLCAAPAYSGQAKLDASALERMVGEHKGAVVVVNFWASWCGPCRREFPVLEQLRAAFDEDRVYILGVSLDFDPDMFTEFAQRQGFGYPVCLAHEQLMDELHIEAIPKTLIFDKRGRLATNHDGPASFAELHAEIVRLSEAPPNQGAVQ
jgi:thiol-disulfide isomerase/thioredoxin